MPGLRTFPVTPERMGDRVQMVGEGRVVRDPGDDGRQIRLTSARTTCGN